MSASLLAPRVLIPFIVATLIWGSTWLVIRDQLGVVPETWSVAYRFYIAAAAMFAWAAVRRDPLMLPPADQRFALLLGLTIFVANFNFVYRAEAHVTSGLVAVVFALLIVPNAIIARLTLGTPLERRFLLGAGVALVGVGMLIVNEVRMDASDADDTIYGVVLTGIGVLFASVGNVMQGSARARAMPLATMLAWGMLWGALANTALALTTAGWPIIDPRPGYIAGVVYLAVAASAVAFACYFAVVRAVGPGMAAYSGIITPIIAMGLSTLFEDYRWSALAVAGGVVSLAGLAVAVSAPRPATKSG